MGAIRPFIRNASFEPEAIEAMSTALEQAKAEMQSQDPEIVEALAIRIITLTSCGELDPERLAQAAVNSFQLNKMQA